MSILINMEMPKERESFTVTIKYNGLVFDTETMIQVAEAHEVLPHGRLIDADVLEELVIKQKYACAGASAHGSISELHKSWGLHDAELMIESAPTIIEAEEGET